MLQLELFSSAVGARGGGEGGGCWRERGVLLQQTDSCIKSFEIRICIKVKLSGLVKYSSKYAKELSY